MQRRDILKGLAVASVTPAVGRWVSAAAADSRRESPTERRPQIALDIEHAKATTPIEGTVLFPLPHPGVRTDTRLALARNGDIYVGGGGHLWKSTDRGETWGMSSLPQRDAGGIGILNGYVFILVLYSDDHSVNSVLRSTDYGKKWSDPVILDIRPFNSGGGLESRIPASRRAGDAYRDPQKSQPR